MTSAVASETGNTTGVTRNVLLITIDDLRTDLNASYGMMHVHTPNLDRLAAEGTVFTNAYCQQAICSPSRNSFMSGRRPDTTRVWNFLNHFREADTGKNWTSMPEWFKKAGYLTYGHGKLFHPAYPPHNDYPQSWTTDGFNSYYWGNGNPIGDAFECGDLGPPHQGTAIVKPLWNQYRTGARTPICYDVDDAASLNDKDNKSAPQLSQLVEYDHRVVTRTIESMQRATQLGRRFFLAAGIRRPHLDWRTPKRFWDMYKDVKVGLAKHQTIGVNVPTLAFQMNGELGNTFTRPSDNMTFRESPVQAGGSPLPSDLQRQLRRGYYAAVSFMDFEVGRMLDALSHLRLENSTAILFHSDHGWKLGEHGDWSKCSNWELDARVPLIIKAPWIDQSRGRKTRALAELVDLYPTAVELAGVGPVPLREGLEGTSLVPVLRRPEMPAPHLKLAAFTQFPRCVQFKMEEDPAGWECVHVPRENITRMGYSVRVAEARYTEWRVWNACRADWSHAGLVASELYDHKGDTGLGVATYDDYEFENVASEPARQSQVKQLAALLMGHFSHNQGC